VSADGSRELLLTGGRVLPPPRWTGWRDGRADPARWPSGVAVRGGRVVAVGTDTEVEAALGSDAERIDLAGRMLLPGFIDAHAHPVDGGLERLRLDLTERVAVADVLTTISDYAARTPSGWLLGGGWSMETFPGGTPRAQLLDDIVGDRLVFLPNRDHHSAWVSSAALRLAGIDAGTPDPAGGRIERDPDGSPTGTLHEAAMDLFEEFLPAPTQEELDAALAEALRYMHGLGVTGWTEAIVGENSGTADCLDLYLAAQADGRLTADVTGALWWPRGLAPAEVPAQVARLVTRRAAVERASAEVAQAGGRVRLRARMVKIMLDGVIESFTASMHEPYLDGRGGVGDNRGISYLDPDLLAAVVTGCEAAGFGVHVHAIGDRAISDTLTAFQAARDANGRIGLPHQIAHLQVVPESDVARWAELGVIANAQALWACHEPQMDLLTLPFIGPERAARQYPFGELHRAGVPLAMGSDWPVSSADPLAAVHVAVNRCAPEDRPDTPDRPPRLLPEQALDVVTALHAYTAGSAVAAGMTDVGQIRVGAFADLVVLDRDPVAVPPDEIADTRVDLTLVAGEPVYEPA
jgi:predicted amidohydrolase YtcJ